jgi:predicted DNA binding CopG/RHH family protein
MKSAQDLEKRAQEIINDENQALWENGELGQSEEHATASIKTTIRLPAALIQSLKTIAGDNGMGYQTYIKSVLHQHVQQLTRTRK